MPLTLGTNSYVTLDEANTYATEQGLAAMSDEAFLMRATKWIDRTFGNRFIGARQNSSQTLNWPRYPTARIYSSDLGCLTLDSDGNPMDLNTIPLPIKEATIEVALMLQEGQDLYTQPAPAVTQESTVVGEISTSKTYSSPFVAKSNEANLYKIELILRPVLAPQSIRFVR